MSVVKRVVCSIATFVLALSTISVVSPLSASAAPGDLTKVHNLTGLPAYRDIVEGTSGNLWFTNANSDKIGRITLDGVVTEFDGSSTPGEYFSTIALGPDGNVWFAGNTGKIHRMSETGSGLTSFAVTSAPELINDIAEGPDGNMWFTMWTNGSNTNMIGKITPTGTVTEYAANSGMDDSEDLTAGSDGNIWFTHSAGDTITKITPTGTATDYDLTGVNEDISDVTLGADGNVWFMLKAGTASPYSYKVGKITPSGTATMYDLPSDVDGFSLTAGNDGNIWFTGWGARMIGSVTPAGVVTVYPSGLASSYALNGLVSTPDGGLWVAATDAIVRYALSSAVPTGGEETITDSQAVPLAVTRNKTITLDGTRASVAVSEGGVLKGTGTVTGELLVNKGGVVAPGHSPGCLTVGTFVLNGDYQFELGGKVSCTEYDQVKATGGVTLSSTTSTITTSRYNSYTPTQGQVFTIIDNQGSSAVSGTFSGLAEGATFEQNGVVFKISYVGGDGNDVTLTVQNVPTAPNTGFSMLFANPVLTLGVTLISAVSIIAVSRKLRSVKA